MRYTSGKEFLDDPEKCILLMGLSGVGKTTTCRLLPSDSWFHYSVDYRIWTHHLGDQLNDFLKSIAMQQPKLRELLNRDAITVEHRVHFDNLFATSVYMGMLGDPEKGGTNEDDFKERMQEYAEAERASMLDIPNFISRSRKLYKYPHFVVDASGSLCEIIELEGQDDVIDMLEANCLVIYIEATDQHIAELVRREVEDPKPIYYRPDFVDMQESELLASFEADSFTELDPKEVGKKLYPAVIEHRIPRYEQLCEKLGYKVSMQDIEAIHSSEELFNLIARTIDFSTQQG